MIPSPHFLDASHQERKALKEHASCPSMHALLNEVMG
jgi:hypothetical protein